ncbi:MAG: hypothetical protein SPL42_02760 [Bacteroidales bacterium]|nr:hypothetical protein [Bacteroidales bacterium]
MSYLKKTGLALLIAATTMFFAGCGLAQLVNLINCKFSLANISNITWAGINLSNIKSISDLSFADLQKAATAIKNKDFKVGCSVNVNAKNETANAAMLCAYDYDLFLDGNSIAHGSNPSKTTLISPQSTTLVSVPLMVDLLGIVKSGETKSVVNFAKNLLDYGNGTESNVKVKFTPYISPANSTSKGTKLPPITLNKTFQ